jgi:hypothetical protein
MRLTLNTPWLVHWASIPWGLIVKEKLARTTGWGGAIIGALDTLVDIGALAEKEVIQ